MAALFVTAGELHVWAQDSAAKKAAAAHALVFDDEPIQPLEKPKNIDPARVALGARLFNDTRLSRDGKMSCATCHQLPAGTLNTKTSIAGVNDKTIPLNIPTIIGSGLNFSQFWDGRADTLETQIDGPVLNANEMGTTWAVVIANLQADKEYVDSFQKIYKSRPAPEHVRDAIAAFERSLVYTDSPFDRYLRGDMNAISAEAKQGYDLFKDLGCTSCHQGQNVGGNMFQKFGIIRDYFAERGNIIDEDYGRYNITKADEDKYVFKVPSLRNVALTAPYFHDGSAATLEDAVDIMARYQLGRDLNAAERSKLVEFLKTLTGKADSHE